MPKGLRNHGNSSYINSVLQLLFAIQPFREGIMKLHFSE